MGSFVSSTRLSVGPWPLGPEKGGREESHGGGCLRMGKPGQDGKTGASVPWYGPSMGGVHRLRHQRGTALPSAGLCQQRGRACSAGGNGGDTFLGTLPQVRKQNPAPGGLVGARSRDKEARQRQRKQPELVLGPAAPAGRQGAGSTLAPQLPPLPGPFVARRDVRGAQAGGGGGAEKSRRLFVLKPSSIFCRHQPSGSSNAIGGKTELFGEC